MYNCRRTSARTVSHCRTCGKLVQHNQDHVSHRKENETPLGIVTRQTFYVATHSYKLPKITLPYSWLGVLFVLTACILDMILSIQLCPILSTSNNHITDSLLWNGYGICCNKETSCYVLQSK